MSTLDKILRRVYTQKTERNRGSEKEMRIPRRQTHRGLRPPTAPKSLTITVKRNGEIIVTDTTGLESHLKASGL